MTKMTKRGNTFILRSFEKELPVPLTQEEKEQRGQRLGQVHGDIDQHDLATKQVNADRKAAKAALVAEASKLALALRLGNESRPVSCQEEADFKQGIAVTRRLDTNDVIPGFGRPLRPEERQSTLFPDGSTKPRKANEKEAADALFNKPTELGEFNGENFENGKDTPSELVGADPGIEVGGTTGSARMDPDAVPAPRKRKTPAEEKEAVKARAVPNVRAAPTPTEEAADEAPAPAPEEDNGEEDHPF